MAPAPKPAGGRLQRRAAVGAGLWAAVGGALRPRAAGAFGPQDAILEVVGYEDVSCGTRAPESVRCIKVTAKTELNAKEKAYNAEVFGRVRYPNDESALYGDFAEASDAGKMGDIDEIPPGKGEVDFVLRLNNDPEEHPREEQLKFVNMKARTYPGMRQNFRQMKPVTATCDPEFDSGCDPEDEVPF